MSKFVKRFIMSISVGIFSGLSVLFFSSAIDAGVLLAKQSLLVLPIGYFVLPLIGGVIIIGLNHLYEKGDVSGIGIAQVLLELEHIKTHFMRPFRVLIRVINATVALIFGFSVGRFGPIVHLGSAIGSNIGYFFKMSPDDIRILIGCGASAAISVVFRTPLFAAVFVLEVLYRKQFSQLFAPVVISSVVGYLIGDFLMHTESIFKIMEPINVNGSDLILYIGLGLVLSIMGIAYMWLIEQGSLWFGKLKKRWVSLILGSVLIGGMALVFPENMELHEQTTFNVMNGNMGVMMLFMVVAFKLIGTGISLGSGFVGGNFYPGVTIGAASGMLFNSVVSPGVANPAYGTLGVGGMIAGFLNAPISGIVFILEASSNPTLMIPALIVCAVSSMFINHIYKKDIFTNTYNRWTALQTQDKNN